MWNTFVYFYDCYWKETIQPIPVLCSDKRIDFYRPMSYSVSWLHYFLLILPFCNSSQNTVLPVVEAMCAMKDTWKSLEAWVQTSALPLTNNLQTWDALLKLLFLFCTMRIKSHVWVMIIKSDVAWKVSTIVSPIVDRVLVSSSLFLPALALVCVFIGL